MTKKVNTKEVEIRPVKPKTFYQLFYKSNNDTDWYPHRAPQEGDVGRENLEKDKSSWHGADQFEFKMISYEI